jgi:hypothetical protein
MMLRHFLSVVGSLGSKTLPVAELSMATVGLKRLPRAPQWNALTVQRDELRFTGTQLAHAVIKADYLEYRNPLLPGIGLVLQSHHIIDWNSQQFCLRAGGATLLSDFARSSLTGRLGQGLALLFSHYRGFSFTCHLREYLESQGISTRGADGRALPVADFLCDGNANDRCIVESKATFSQQQNCLSSTKSDLKSALDKQVLKWMNRVNPPVAKSFVVKSYLREHTDPHSDPSVLAFVDPPGDDEERDVELSSATVRRENYAAWLTAMGLTAEGERLRNRQADGRQEVPFIVFEIGQRRIAFPAEDERMFWPDFFHYGHTLPIGIDDAALTAIENSVAGDDEPLLAYVPQDGFPVQGEGYAYSVFPDGSFLGNFRRRPPVDFRRVSL